MKKELKLTPNQMDSLKEIASIGVSHAATALSKMLDKKVMILVPQVNILPISEFTNYIGSSYELIVGIYFRILGKASGRILLSFKKQSAFNLADLLQNRKQGFTRILTEFDQSALNETGTILTASCLNALADFLGMTFMPSVPHFRFDNAQAIVDAIFRDLTQDISHTVVVDSEFSSADAKVKGRFFIFPDENALDVIFRAVTTKWTKL